MKKLLLSTAIAFMALTTTAQTKRLDILTAQSKAPSEKYFKLSMSIDMSANDTSRYMQFQNAKYSSITDLGIFRFEDYNELNELFMLMEKAMDDGEDITYNFGEHTVSDRSSKKKNFVIFFLESGEYTVISRRQINEVRLALGMKGGITPAPNHNIPPQPIGEPTESDIITTKEGDEIQVNILEVGLETIKYKKADNPEGAIHTIAKSDVFMIKYKNGTKDTFKTGTKAPVNTIDMRMQGARDAEQHYKQKNTGAGGTAITTILLSPLIGWIPPAICASITPKDHNLEYPNTELMKNLDYSHAYKKTAHRKKKIRLWGTFGISSGVWLILVAAL